MKKISWITPTCYVDVDLPIINKLRFTYEIYWIVILESNSGKDTIDYINKCLKNNKSINIVFLWQKHRLRSLKNLTFIRSYINLALSKKPDIIYISEYAQPYGIFLYSFLLPINKTVAACHNVSTPEGATKEKFARFYTNIWLKLFKNIQTFSESQKKVLLKKYNNKNILMANLALKDYGPALAPKKNSGIIRFLSFGNIVRYKRIDLVIKAANILYERGIKNFKIIIAGKCNNWNNEYLPLIKYPEHFELQIERIPNENISELFSSSDYFVLPYQDIAQSGAITVAFRYNVPVICSDIEPFKEFVEDHINGFTFHSKDEISLADTMQEIIINHNNIYDKICKNQKLFVEQNFSIESITNKYVDFFNNL